MGTDRRATPYGFFAADYEESRLIELCVPEGGVQTGPFGSQLHQRDYVEVGTPIITVEHLGDNRISHKSTPMVSAADRDRLSRYQLRPGDIVFSRVGSVDRRALVREEEAGWLFSGRCLRVRPNPERIDPTYLSYFFGHEAFKEYVRAIAVGATMPSINTEILSNVPVILPPTMYEQQAIASILGTLDDKIELNRRMSETLERIATAVFRDWFLDFGPTRTKLEGGEAYLPSWLWEQFPSELIDSPLGPLPDSWHPGSLGEVVEILDSKRIPLAKHERLKRQGPFPYYGAASVMDYVDDFLFEGVHLLMGEDGSVMKEDGTPVLQYVWDKFWVNNHAHVLRGLSPISTEHLMLYLKQINISPFVTGAVQAKLNQGNLKRIPFIQAPNNINEEFQAIIGPLFGRVRTSIEESRILGDLRDTLLPKLISGELRIQDAEKLVSEVV